jgi:pyridoxal biosynthesis lyase PdxS
MVSRHTLFYFPLQVGHAQMLKGGVIMDVMNPEQARIAEKAGAVAGAERTLKFKGIINYP